MISYVVIKQTYDVFTKFWNTLLIIHPMKFWTLENEWKASRFWRTEPWKEKLPLIEISPVMVLSWEYIEDVSLPQQLILRWFKKKKKYQKTAIYWSEELRDKVSHHILLPWQPLPQESNEIINDAQISGWPLTAHAQRRHKIAYLEEKKIEMLFGRVLTQDKSSVLF